MPTTPILLGLTGLRYAGKSTVAKMLVEEFGFAMAHPFNPGKVMLAAYYEYCGIDRHTAERMVYGDLKDTPHPRLPGGVDSRYAMERLGKYMGTDSDFGMPWTLGVEVRKLREEHSTAVGFVVESIVYEHESFRALGGRIIRLARHGARPTGHHSDEAQAKIIEDYRLDNHGDRNELRIAIRAMMNTFGDRR